MPTSRYYSEQLHHTVPVGKIGLSSTPSLKSIFDVAIANVSHVESRTGTCEISQDVTYSAVGDNLLMEQPKENLRQAETHRDVPINEQEGIECKRDRVRSLSAGFHSNGLKDVGIEAPKANEISCFTSQGVWKYIHLSGGITYILHAWFCRFVVVSAWTRSQV